MQNFVVANASVMPRSMCMRMFCRTASLRKRVYCGVGKERAK